MEDIIGQELKQGSASISTSGALAGVQFVGIYFGAHWAPPCRRFTETLTGAYTALNKENKKFEVIFCSSDGNADAFKRNFEGMPWLAIDYSDEATKASLLQRYGVTEIPTLIIIDSEGNLISYEGSKEILNSPAEALAEWEKARSKRA